MTLMKKTTSVLALVLSLSLLGVGVAVNVSAGEEPVEIAKNDRIIKPFKAGTEMYCRFDEYTALWSCRH